VVLVLKTEGIEDDFDEDEIEIPVEERIVDVPAVEMVRSVDMPRSDDTV